MSHSVDHMQELHMAYFYPKRPDWKSTDGQEPIFGNMSLNQDRILNLTQSKQVALSELNQE